MHEYPAWARETAHVVDRPWGDADWLALGDNDPHAATATLADMSVIDELNDDPTHPLPFTGTEAAAEVARRWNECAELREFLFIWGEAKQVVDEVQCGEQDTGACATIQGVERFDYCDRCKEWASAWDALQGIERVMSERYDEMREAGYER